MAESASELHAEIEKLERRHAEHPEGRYFVPLANAYRKLGEVGRAERLLHEGLRHHPDYLSAHIVLGRCLADRDAVAEAAQEFRYVLTLDSQNLIALRTLGELAAAQGRTEEAERWYEQLLAVDPMNEEARRALESLRGLSDEEAEFDAGSGWWQRRVEPAAPPAAPAAPAPEPVAPEPLVAPEPASASQEEEPDWQDLLVRDQVLDEPPAPAEEEEVVTETIAELYARQGFPERAAEVYRTLIRQRGGDPTLELRLAELEAEGAGRPPEGAAPPLVPPAPAPDDEPLVITPIPSLADPVWEDAFADSFAGGFPDDEPGTFDPWSAEPAAVEAEEVLREGPAEAEPSLEAAATGWEEADREPAPAAAVAGSSPPVGAFLRDLIHWRPAGAGEAVAPGAPRQEPAAPSQAVGQGTGRAEEDEPFPWEIPAPGAAPAAGEPREEEAGVEAAELFSFESFISEPAGAPEPPSPPAVARTEPEPEGEEDDLESFQAWLRSLKR